ncbi:hypothetical protein B4U79_08439 [Dinothrombium tinctorium]|uniref:PIH1D1/2/3 CS-like domain-containing protein n=1 Tax=Dinothrombium tinctorium TaxID=1965070 RepID=A0A3S3QCD3_9ACAR|nr:hypothetical protein B4U79_08439 [Dinothrombium tinctorium]
MSTTALAYTLSNQRQLIIVETFLLKVVKNKRKETSSIIDERTPKYKLNFDLSARTLTLTAHLLKLKSTKDLHLMLNDDRISLLSNEYELDLFIPINVVANEARAQFNKSNQRFTLTVPVSEC